MKINYDRVVDAIYLKMKNGRIVKTVPVNSRINVDLNSKGETLGIELLDASSQQAELEKYVKQGIPIEITASTPITA